MGRRPKSHDDELQLLLPKIPRLRIDRAKAARARARVRGGSRTNQAQADRLKDALVLVTEELRGLPPFLVHKGFILGTRFARALDEWRPEVLAAMVAWWRDHRAEIRQEYAYFAKGSPALTAVWRRADEAYHESLKSAPAPACARELVASLVTSMGGKPMSEDEAQAVRLSWIPKPPPFQLPPYVGPTDAAARAREDGERRDAFIPRLEPGRPRTGPQTNPTARARPRARVYEGGA